MKKLIFIFSIIFFFSFTPEKPVLINSFPYFVDFESEALCGTSCSGTCNLLGGWKNAVQYGLPATTTKWLAEDGSTPSTATGPDIDHTLGTATGIYLYVESSGCNNATANLVSDQLDFTSLTAPAIEFWYHMYGATMGTLQVDVSTNGGMSFTDVTPTFTDNINIWQFKRIALSAYAGMPDVRIRIKAITGSSFTSDMAIDDIRVFDCSGNIVDLQQINLASGNCFLTNNEIVIPRIYNDGCVPVPMGTSFDLTCALDGGSPVTQNFVLASPLNVNTTQDFTLTTPFDLSGGGYKTIDCSIDLTGNLSSNTSDTVSFYSGNNVYPYNEDFEPGAAGWTVEAVDNVNPLTTLELGTPAKPVINSAHSGVNAWVTNSTGNYADLESGAVVSPCFDMRPLLDANFAMWIWWNCEFSWDGAVLQSSIDGKNSWQNVGAFGEPNNWYTDNTINGIPGGQQEGWSGRASTLDGSGGWVLAQHDISNLVGISPVYFRIAFGTDGSVTDDGFAFDDISITGTSNCPLLVFDTTQDGNYNDPATWDGCPPPNPIPSNVVVNLNHSITIPVGFTLENNGTINANELTNILGTYTGTGAFVGTLVNQGVVAPGN